MADDRVLAVLVAAGDGNRLGRPEGKALVALAGRPLFTHTLATLLGLPEVEHVAVVARAQDLAAVHTAIDRYLPSPVTEGRVTVTAGGPTRHDSVRLGLQCLSARVGVVPDLVTLVHDAARPLASAKLCRAVSAAVLSNGDQVVVAPAVTVVDALRGATGDAVERKSVRAVQTPQGARLSLLLAAHRAAEAAGAGQLLPDDLTACEAIGAAVVLVEGERQNLKITTPPDLDLAESLLRGNLLPRSGIGFDVHPLAVVPGGSVRLGGVSIPAGMVLQGYSDADAAVHAIIDALLGAVGAGDIGQRFPPGESRWRGANSLDLLATAWGELAGRGFVLGNVDVTIQAERPPLSPHYATMRERIAAALCCRAGAISIKATTMEGLGAIGRAEGIAAFAVATVFGPVDG